MTARRLALLAALTTVAGLAPAASATPARVALPGSVPAWATPAHRVGDLADDADVAAQLILPWRDPAAARDLAYAVSDPAHPSYGRHLTPAQFRARFSPSDTTVSAVTAWARSAGLEVGEIPANRLVVPVRGPADVVERAFGVSLGSYAVDGLVLRAPDAAPRLPLAVARLVGGVRGLDQGAALLRAGDEPPPPLPEEPPTPADTTPPTAVVYAKPCSAYEGATVNRKLPKFGGRNQPAVSCGTSPQAVQAVYGATAQHRKKVTGAGQTVVVVGSHAIKPLRSDVDTWSKRHRLPALRPDQLRQVSYPGAYQTPVSEPVLRPTVWAVQASTLFETVHTIAPAADMLYVGTTSSFDLATGTLLAVDGAWGTQVVNGWYTTTENVPAGEWELIDAIAAQAAATGISLLFAAGDLGDNSYTGGTPTTVYPASEPLATSVGATSLLLGKGGRYVRELAWGKAQYVLDGRTWEEDDPKATYRGSGGGTSNRHLQPAYQRGVVPASIATERNDGKAGRAVPDLAVLGDAETAMTIGYTQRFPDGKNRYSERRVASSTASTALVAALLALASDRLNRQVGFANPALYAAWKADRATFRDVVRYGRAGAGVRTDHVNGATPAGGMRTVLKAYEEFGENVPRRGYDTSTGLGSPSPKLLATLR